MVNFHMFYMGSSPGEDFLWMWEKLKKKILYLMQLRVMMFLSHVSLFCSALNHFSSIFTAYSFCLFVFFFCYLQKVYLWKSWPAGVYGSHWAHTAAVFPPNMHTNAHAAGPPRLHSFAAAASVVTMEILFIT